MALPTYQAAGTSASTSAGAGTSTPTWPTHQANDIGLLFVETLGTDAAPAAPAGWTEAPNSPQNAPSNGTRLSIFWKRATSGAETNPGIPDPGEHCYAVIHTFRGCCTVGTPIHAAASDGADSTATVTIPGPTTTAPDMLIVLALAWGLDNAGPLIGALTNGALANITERQDAGTTDVGGGGVYMATGEKATAGAVGNSTATSSPATTQARIALALQPQNAGASAVTLGAVTVAAGGASSGRRGSDFADTDDLLSSMLEGMLLPQQRGLV